MMERKVETKNMVVEHRITTSNTYKENDVPSSNPPQRLTPKQIEERGDKGLFFNCDNKYNQVDKCK